MRHRNSLRHPRNQRCRRQGPWQVPGPACYGAWETPSRVLNPESLRGSYCYDLTLGITRDTPAKCREGSTDLSRLNERDRSRSGQCSCDSTVTRGIDYTFTWSKRVEYLAPNVFALAGRVHLHRDSHDLAQPALIEVSAIMHKLTHATESLAVNLLGRHQRIRSKMWQDTRYQISNVSDLVFQGPVGSIGSNEPTSPSLLDNC
jgi:hypothetical protein